MAEGESASPGAGQRTSQGASPGTTDLLARRLLAICLPASVLFSLTSSQYWAAAFVQAPVSAVLQTLLAAAAWMSLRRPDAPGRLLTVAALVVVNTAYELPEVPNHRLTITLVALALLVAYATRARRGWDATVRETFATGRWLVLVIYAFAAFAKLNGTFTDPTTSCASDFAGDIAYFPDRLFPAAIAGAIVIEGGLVPLLLGRRTRTFGVFLGLLFHFGLSLNFLKHFLDFSSAMTCGLVLFLPLDAVERSLGGAGDAARRTERFSRALAAAFLGIAAVVMPVDLVAMARLPSIPVLGYARQLVWLAYASAVIAVSARCLFERRLRPVDHAFRIGRASILLVLLAFLNGSSPYLGLKTRTAFSMYSNLDLDADRSNHWLVPRSADLLGLLRDRVQVVSTTIDALAPYAVEGVELTFLEFSRLCARAEAGQVEYRRNGESGHFVAGRDAVPRSPWLARKLTLFQPLGEGAADACIW